MFQMKSNKKWVYEVEIVQLKLDKNYQKRQREDLMPEKESVNIKTQKKRKRQYLIGKKKIEEIED